MSEIAKKRKGQGSDNTIEINLHSQGDKNIKLSHTMSRQMKNLPELEEFTTNRDVLQMLSDIYNSIEECGKLQSSSADNECVNTILLLIKRKIIEVKDTIKEVLHRNDDNCELKEQLEKLRKDNEMLSNALKRIIKKEKKLKADLEGIADYYTDEMKLQENEIEKCKEIIETNKNESTQKQEQIKQDYKEKEFCLKKQLTDQNKIIKFFQNKIKEMEKNEKTKENENERLSKEQVKALNNLETKFIALKNKTAEQNNDLINKTKMITHLREELRNLNDNYKLLLQEVEKNKELIETKNSEMKQLAFKIKDNQICKTCPKFESTCKEFEDLVTKLYKELENEQNKQQSKSEKFYNEVNTLKKQLTDKDKLVKELKAIINNKDQQIEAQTQELQKKNIEIKNMQHNLIKINSTLSQSKDHSNKKISNLDNEINELNNKLQASYALTNIKPTDIENANKILLNKLQNLSNLLNKEF